MSFADWQDSKAKNSYLEHLEGVMAQKIYHIRPRCVLAFKSQIFRNAEHSSTKSSCLANSHIGHICKGVSTQKLHFYHFCSNGDPDLWLTLRLKFSEMIDHSWNKSSWLAKSRTLHIWILIVPKLHVVILIFWLLNFQKCFSKVFWPQTSMHIAYECWCTYGPNGTLIPPHIDLLLTLPLTFTSYNLISPSTCHSISQNFWRKYNNWAYTLYKEWCMHAWSTEV